ncbi:MAG: GspH/FimT family protein [Comamonas sp.]
MNKSIPIGFTLIETMIVIAIIAILAMIGMPAMKSMVERNAVAGQVNSMIGALTIARSEAIKRNASVVMCRSADAEITSTPKCSTGSNWESGWLVFVDRDGNRQFSAANGDVLLRVQGEFKDSGGISQYGRAITLVFRGTGILQSNPTGFTFASVSQTSSQQRKVCVGKTGRARSTRDDMDFCAR